MIALLRRLFCRHHYKTVPDRYLMQTRQRLRRTCIRCGCSFTVRAC